MNKKFSKLSLPYLIWLFVFAIIPTLFMVFLMFVDSEGLDFGEMRFTFDNFRQLAEPSTRVAFLNSVLLAFSATMISIILGYLIAYKLYRSHLKNKFIILVILVLPMWTNILLRTYALANVMDTNNIITSILSKIFGYDVEFLKIRGSYLAVLIGLVVTYVPFMVMPIYNALEKIDPTVEEAALDLGLTDFSKFWKVIVPMSLKGIITGSIMVFLPALSSFAIPQILGDEKVVMVGNIIEELFKNMSYGTGSVLSIIILFAILLSIFVVGKIDKEGETLL